MNATSTSHSSADQPLKLLRVALDPAAGDGEAANAATMFVRVARRSGVTFDLLTLAAAKLLPAVRPSPVAPTAAPVPSACPAYLHGHRPGGGSCRWPDPPLRPALASPLKRRRRQSSGAMKRKGIYSFSGFRKATDF